MIVVTLVIGILAAAVAPKMFSNAERARDSSVRQSLSVVRTAIELYRADNDGAMPGTSESFKDDLADYLRGPFPTSPVGTKDANVSLTGDVDITADAVPVSSWKFSLTSGEFIVNSGATTATDPSMTYEEW